MSAPPLHGTHVSVPIPTRMGEGLTLLLQAYTYAKDARTNLWDFALETDKLFEAGMTISDLRWLVVKGFAQHGKEDSTVGDQHRTILPCSGIVFDLATCIALTKDGAGLAKHWLACSTANSGNNVLPASANQKRALNGKRPSGSVLVPRWDSSRRELFLADTVVKRFRVPARNQETILCVFQEEGWPEHIDDPLPVCDEIDPRTRLHDTINRLNRCQRRPLLRFHGNGCGNGISWEVLQDSLND